MNRQQRRAAGKPADAVTVAYVHQHEVSYSWHSSMVALIGHDLAHTQRVMRGGWLGIRYGTGGLPAARDLAVQQFLDGPQADWLWWVDTDMGFAPDTVDQLVASADPTERPIMGALCFAWKEHTLDGMGGFRCMAAPTVYDWGRLESGEEGFAPRAGYERDSVVRAAGTGSACILIHRSVFEKIRDQFGACWYQPVPNPTTGVPVSEDLAFCMRAGAAGIPVHVNTAVKTTHHKQVWVSELDMG